MKITVQVFCGYLAEDENLRRGLKAHLTTLTRDAVVYKWHDRLILPGPECQVRLDEKVECADVIILLVSSSFISSDYCYGLELRRAMERHDANRARIVPVIIRPSIWRETPLRNFNVLPKGGKPISVWEDSDQAWTDVAKGIRELIENHLLGPFYRKLCMDGRNALSACAVDIAPFVDDLTQDKRLGLTLIVRPSPKVAKQLMAINNRLKQLGPRHFYYGQSRFHFTILSLINATDPPKHSQDLTRLYVKSIQEVLKGFSPFEVEFSGICATPNSIIAKGFPVRDALERLRVTLREILTVEGLGRSIDERYRIRGAHITLARFKLLEDFTPLIELIDQIQEEPLGRMRVDEAQLAINDFYMSPDRVQILAKLPIGPAHSPISPVKMCEENVSGSKRYHFQNSTTPGERPAQEQRAPTIGIITALEKEYLTVKALLDNLQTEPLPGEGAGRRYLVGEIPAANGCKHCVVLSLADQGNNIAANRATLLLEHFPTVKYIIMAGIAGGVPYPEKPDEHVRLGDVVVSNQKGVIQYDFDKETINETLHRHPPRPPSATLIEGVRFLRIHEMEGKVPWTNLIKQAVKRLKIKRPPEATDVLASSVNQNILIPHPKDPKRIKGQPKIHLGPIASANKLLKNPVKRDELRDNFGVKAIEMESSGIADATWNHEVGYLVVRGICDYCDSNKGDEWQEYAALVAAAYMRALLESMPCTDQTAPQRRPIIHSLKPKPTNFVGRDDEYAHIMKAIGGANCPVIITSGFGGIGKTTLVMVVAWACVEQKGPFDFIVCVDNRKYKETVSLDFVLNEIGRTADINSDIPNITSQEPKKDRVRELLKSHRSLLILDNYEDLLNDSKEEENVSVFLRSLPIGPVTDDTCIRVLITTREMTEGLKKLPHENVRLQKMSEKDSLEMMRLRTPKHLILSDEQYSRIWEKLCGLPKYMEMVPGQLETMTFEDWEKMFADLKIPLDEADKFFRDFFQHSWERCPDDFKKILLSVTYFAGEASSEALQKTSGLSGGRFRTLLASASDTYIQSTGTGYTVHPLIHAFCRAVLNSEEFCIFRRQADFRFVKYFFGFTRAAHEAGKHDLVERELRNVIAASKLGEKLQAWNYLIGFRDYTTAHLRHRGYWQEQKEISLLAATAARRLGKGQIRAECLVYDLGWIFLRLEDLEAAEAHVKEGLRLFQKLGDCEGIAQSARHLGKLALLKGLNERYEPKEIWQETFSEAENRYMESLQSRIDIQKEGTDQREKIGDMKLDFGRLFWLQGKGFERNGRRRGERDTIDKGLEKYNESNRVTLEAVDLFKEVYSDRGIAKAWGNLGNATKEIVKFMLNDNKLDSAIRCISKAHEYYAKSLEIAKKIKRKDEIAHAFWGLSEVYELFADYPDLHKRLGEAKMLLKRALSYAEGSYRIYTSLGGSKDIRATKDLCDRTKDKLFALEY